VAERAERLRAIRDYLKKQNVITVKQLAKELSVSDMTVRRDISVLEQDNVVEVFYGGVSLKNPHFFGTSDYEIENELFEHKEQKDSIARKAASLVEQNDSIFIDTGSTTGAVVNHIDDHMKLSVYSYALNTINEVSNRPNMQLVACGGYFHQNTRMFESDEGAALMKKTYINKAFLAARGITPEVGVTTAESYEIKMKKAALSVSRQKILLVDSTKFGKAWYAKYADLAEIDAVITDARIEDKHKEIIESMGIELIIA